MAANESGYEKAGNVSYKTASDQVVADCSGTYELQAVFYGFEGEELCHAAPDRAATEPLLACLLGLRFDDVPRWL